MENDKKLQRILLPIDGSNQSMDTVKYVSKILPPERTEIILFNIEFSIPETIWDLENNPELSSSMVSVKAWASQEKDKMHDFMEKVQVFLFNAGFSKKNIIIKIQPRKLGFARDIFAESMIGYTAVFFGRTGKGTIEELVFGSVANKLIEKIIHIPFVVVGEEPSHDKFLIAMDGSKGSLKGLTCIASMISPINKDISLCHIIRPLNLPNSKNEEEWIEDKRNKIEPIFEAAKDTLVNSGFAIEKIESLILSDKSSRAGGLIEEAKSNNFGSIVLGRRGLTIVEDFHMGRVSTKILSLARKMAVWIVN
ncbi:MAG: universal stress protein [Desulfobacterales bacterium]|nr:universal stress protein [Desulfobacterales bacterium]